VQALSPEETQLFQYPLPSLWINIIYKVGIASNSDKHKGKKKGNDARCSMRGLLSFSKRLSWKLSTQDLVTRMTTTAGRARGRGFGENEGAI
jgi:hypothetical protein